MAHARSYSLNDPRKPLLRGISIFSDVMPKTDFVDKVKEAKAGLEKKHSEQLELLTQCREQINKLTDTAIISDFLQLLDQGDRDELVELIINKIWWIDCYSMLRRLGKGMCCSLLIATIASGFSAGAYALMSYLTQSTTTPEDAAKLGAILGAEGGGIVGLGAGLVIAYLSKEADSVYKTELIELKSTLETFESNARAIKEYEKIIAEATRETEMTRSTSKPM